MKPAEIDIDRVTGQLETLATHSSSEPPGVTRVLFTEADLSARRYLRGLMEAVGLEVRQDAAGNLFGTWYAGDRDAPRVATGSHCDAIPHSGIYDGTVGVLGGLEAIRSLKAGGFEPKRPVELIMFTSEEPTRYGIGCLGSRLMGGAIDVEAAGALTDEEGVRFEETRRTAGCDGTLADVGCGRDAFAAFVELHIEQGPLLEKSGRDIGAVTAIAAPATLRVTFTGIGGHAGAVLMPVRRDALLPAAELALFVDEAARNRGGEDTVATTGVLKVHPGAVNSIPSRTTLEIDIRDTDGPRRDQVLEAIRTEAERVGGARGIEVDVELINADPPATCDERIVAAVRNACDAVGATHEMMISRAYHDSLFMARIAPTGMIFIPCREGISHRPEEYASPEAMKKGIDVLARTLAELAG